MNTFLVSFNQAWADPIASSKSQMGSAMAQIKSLHTTRLHEIAKLISSQTANA
jgi:hypothetical protein